MALVALEHNSDKQKAYIDTCYDAVQACEWCADACTGEGEEMAKYLRLCQDIAGTATLLIPNLARDSNYTPELAEVCAGTAKQYAAECDRHDGEHCQACAKVLRDCAASCRDMTSTQS